MNIKSKPTGQAAMSKSKRSTTDPPRIAGPRHDPGKTDLPQPDASGRRTSRAIFAGALLILAVWMAYSFWVSIAWAAVLALAIWPLYRTLVPTDPPRRAWVAPLATTIVTGLVLAIPVLLMLTEMGREAQDLVDWIAAAQKSGIPVPSLIANLPFLGSHFDQWWRANLSSPGGFAKLFGDFDVESAAGWTRSLGGELAYRLLLALLTLIALFLFLRDGRAIAGRLLRLSEQWLGYPGERLFEKMVVAVRSVVNGTVIVAIAEGLLIGIAYIIMGVPRPYIMALITMAFAMLPLGAWFAFTAATIVLLLTGGSGLAAGVVFGWGALIMVIGDNFVQPALIGGVARLPFLWVLMGILGGLETFGLVGVFLGPVIMAALLTIWRDWLDG